MDRDRRWLLALATLMARAMELARRRATGGAMVRLIRAAVIGLVVAVLAPPATAYVVQVATSIPLISAQDETHLESAVQSALADILTRAIAFTPTIVTLQQVRVVDERIYILFLIADREGEAMIETFVGRQEGITMKSAPGVVRLPWHEDDAIAPVTIFDAEGHVVRVVPATEFHRPGPTPRGQWHERRRRLSRPTAGRTGPEE